MGLYWIYWDMAKPTFAKEYLHHLSSDMNLISITNNVRMFHLIILLKAWKMTQKQVIYWLGMGGLPGPRAILIFSLNHKHLWENKLNESQAVHNTFMSGLSCLRPELKVICVHQQLQVHLSTAITLLFNDVSGGILFGWAVKQYREWEQQHEPLS